MLLKLINVTGKTTPSTPGVIIRGNTNAITLNRNIRLIKVTSAKWISQARAPIRVKAAIQIIDLWRTDTACPAAMVVVVKTIDVIARDA